MTPVPYICTYKMGVGSPINDWQIQLNGALNLLPLTFRDVGSDGLGGTLYRFGGEFQTGQDLHLFAAVVEGCLQADERLHAVHPGRKLGIVDIQFGIGGELAGVTARALVMAARRMGLPRNSR